MSGAAVPAVRGSDVARGRVRSGAVKGVILAGGTGTRLYPLTRITNKHLLPLYDRPMVTYAIEALVSAGISELMLVTGGTHAGEFFRLLGNGHEHGVDRLLYAYQEEAGGIAEALGLAERFVDRRHGRVMLADNIFERSRAARRSRTSSARTTARASCWPSSTTRSTSATSACRSSTTAASGASSRSRRRRRARYAVTGIYFYDEAVWDVLPTLKPSARGELEITDVNNWYVDRGAMEYDVVEGFWGDAGESIDAYYEVNDFVRANGVNR